MAYTEIKERNKNKYYYRVKSVREGNKVKKKRIYLGKDLVRKDLETKEREADEKIINEDLDSIKKKIIRVLKRYNIKRAGLFGSYVRGDQKKNSDVDILIRYPKGMGFNFAKIQFDLEDSIKKKIDLLTYGGIHPSLKEKILSEEVRII